MRVLHQLSSKPILVKIGLLMSAIVILAIISMLSSVFIAQTTEGMATAINQSGSLRMQSYRIGLALADDSIPPYRRAESASALALEFESRLASPRLVNAIPGQSDNQVNTAYTRVQQLWQKAMQPPLRRHIELLREEAANTSETISRASYLAGVDAFVAQIDDLVGLLEATYPASTATWSNASTKRHGT